jgi:peptidyl-dipeptidase Dcp
MAYLADTVIYLNDGFKFFQDNGGLSREIGEEFKKHVLSVGGSLEPMTAFRNFRGQEPNIEALLIRRGLR